MTLRGIDYYSVTYGALVLQLYCRDYYCQQDFIVIALSKLVLNHYHQGCLHVLPPPLSRTPDLGVIRRETRVCCPVISFRYMFRRDVWKMTLWDRKEHSSQGVEFTACNYWSKEAEDGCICEDTHKTAFEMSDDWGCRCFLFFLRAIRRPNYFHCYLIRQQVSPDEVNSRCY